ncbi:uncharacterized protein LOC128243623 [Mya arenaria]|uniref:uncharacterized protein LOC128243622 n=1 Tax=Mya arenaria TaxID=6604 RepID=UPI0022E4B794|nr:uncharacterized protein LOC128243622 [Mya arenaria]XP_052817460.1 uncharacterized protein LOC128243623 [Mya arenaria]
MSTKDAKPVIGLVVLGFSALSQLVCLFLTRVLVKLKHGDYTSTMKTLLYTSSFLEQISFMVFHIKYQYMNIDFDSTDECTVLRFLSTFFAAFSTMWILCISVFYLVLTIKPQKCFSFHARFLSHCTAWTWTCVSSLMYLVLAFLLRERYMHELTHQCWSNIRDTIHMYSTYGNEIIPLMFVIMVSSIARLRISKTRYQLGNFMQNSECNINGSRLVCTLNGYVVLSSLLVLYYILLTFRILLDPRGSDIVLMLFQAGRGYAIAITTCFLDEDVLSLVCKRTFQRPTVVTSTNGRSAFDNNQEMQTFIFQ